ncbi:helix-turn-helix domain-containing protein [Flavobacterium hibernum]|uniref:Transcriptional regulator n=1 Tax=Flavobacterium hibernum TaxID=37752 RepID=A0ABX4BZ58_9FLAO|nr:helix-turn-helix transcriptional regulator [Flavobacterium hibernum]OXA84628.1 transcriptional regulator [Flavobacterium hibernum]PTS99811.1 XRE family transcriptional regulator [Flavobacterium sp. HMWF030]STO10318.1 Helix-turn-helix domain [Flavobacterium hibernum]
MNKIVSHNIRTIREMKNLTRDFVAGELEMTYSGYGKIERGEIDITISKISRLADIFGISISDLLFFDVSYFFNNDAEEKIDDQLRIGSNSDIKTLRISRSRLMDFQDKKLKNRV